MVRFDFETPLIGNSLGLTRLTIMEELTRAITPSLETTDGTLLKPLEYVLSAVSAYLGAGFGIASAAVDSDASQVTIAATSVTLESLAPTATRTARPEASAPPTHSPTECMFDSDSWFKRDAPHKDCAWASQWPPRCDAVGDDLSLIHI